MFKKFIILLIILNTSAVFAEVIVPGGPVTDSVWTKANSPYRIDGHVTIDSLIIEPGVEILFQGDFRFEVNGILVANGFYSDSIFFKQHSINPNGWQGILFNDCTESSELSYCHIEETNNYGIRVDDCIAPLSISNCKLINNDGNGLFITSVFSIVRKTA